MVSGLAKGIDGAAHRGALRAGSRRVVGVVANGLDTPYPRVNADLWESWPATVCCCRSGRLAPSRSGSGSRNATASSPRSANSLVVVESRERGGSLTTAREALERSIEVMAVPGSVNNRAAAGTNQLIRDGATPVTDVADVLLALGLDHRRVGRGYDPRPLPRGDEARVLERCRADPCTLDDVVADLGLSAHRGGDEPRPPRAVRLGPRGRRLVRGGGAVPVSIDG